MRDRKRIEELEKEVAELREKAQPKREIIIDGKVIQNPGPTTISLGESQLVTRQEFEEYKRRSSKLRSELMDRIVRLEKKQAESYCMIQSLPKLYLEIETLKKYLK